MPGLFVGLFPALLPILLLSLLLYFVPHSGKHLLGTLLLGAVAAFALVFPERYSIQLIRASGIFGASLWTALIPPLWEEGVKFLLLGYFYRPEYSKRLFCCIGLALALGFASAENLWYVLNHGIATIYGRLWSGSLVHLSLGLVMASRIFRRQKTFLIAFLWHGAYNIALEQNRGGGAAVVLLLLLCYSVWQWRRS
ncbi:MAG: PrsW family glutamic-type intramembrane protease [Spirochaetota bacterium]